LKVPDREFGGVPEPGAAKTVVEDMSNPARTNTIILFKILVPFIALHLIE
jgi:hypothetical protein